MSVCGAKVTPRHRPTGATELDQNKIVTYASTTSLQPIWKHRFGAPTRVILLNHKEIDTIFKERIDCPDRRSFIRRIPREETGENIRERVARWEAVSFNTLALTSHINWIFKEPGPGCGYSDQVFKPDPPRPG